MVSCAVGCSDHRGLEACPPGVRQLFFLFDAFLLLVSPLPVLGWLLVLVALFQFEVIIFGLYHYRGLIERVNSAYLYWYHSQQVGENLFRSSSSGEI